MDFGGLSLGVSCHDAFAADFEAAHLRLDPASGVVSVPALPERPTVVASGTQCFVADLCRRAIFFPRPTMLAGLPFAVAEKLNAGAVPPAG